MYTCEDLYRRANVSINHTSAVYKLSRVGVGLLPLQIPSQHKPASSHVTMLTKLVLSCALFGHRLRLQHQRRSTANPGDLPLNTYVEGCRDPPCQLPQLQDAVINVQFRAPRPLATLRTLATAYLRIGLISIPINYDLQEHSETCQFLTNAQCPLAEGSSCSTP
ncbi:hypothetical protein EVAR_94908_1 [Eumeta japonica]|uniref:MD-2-related lipid-recognition domain-containing protein n=1 Tax=Eumeta variegata TaxID=151549 RepID=A0A4C1VCW0_EUMVA|nr:hypothetical protein EVAR_94908_1 [Eumeta japonica]